LKKDNPLAGDLRGIADGLKRLARLNITSLEKTPLKTKRCLYQQRIRAKRSPRGVNV